jgi:hypothetical protein
MVRISKQEERRSTSPRRPTLAGKKSGPKKDALKNGYKEHPNAVEGAAAKSVFIPKIRQR